MELFAEAVVEDLSTLRAHPAADVFPMLESGEMAELAEDIKARGLIEAIVLDADGLIVDGRNRLEACGIAGVNPRFVEYIGSDPIGYIVSKNLKRRHLTQSQKSAVAVELLPMLEEEARKRQACGQGGVLLSANLREANGKASDKAGEMLGVSGRSVEHAAAVQRQAPEVFERVKAGDIAASTAAQVAGLPEADRHAVAAAPKDEINAVAKEAIRKAHVAYNGGNNEWYTPADIVEAARTVLGEIDLDPASSDAANKIVKASAYYTAADDGLSKPWRGRVWMNPPYETGLIEKFTARLRECFDADEVSEAIVLVNNATETRWFQNLAASASMLCLVTGRIRFWSETKETASPLQGQAILYFGVRREAFARGFRSFGIIWERPA